MKKIEALISPEFISPVRDLLEERHISNFLFSNVIARSTAGVRQQVYRGHAYDVDFEAEVKLEAVVQDDQATDTAYAILKAAAGPGVSCKPRVLLAPVNQVIVQLEEAGVEPSPPVGRLKHSVEAAPPPGKPLVNPVDRPAHFVPR